MNQRLAVGVSNLLSGRLEAVIGQSAARMNFFGRGVERRECRESRVSLLAMPDGADGSADAAVLFHLGGRNRGGTHFVVHGRPSRSRWRVWLNEHRSLWL